LELENIDHRESSFVLDVTLLLLDMPLPILKCGRAVSRRSKTLLATHSTGLLLIRLPLRCRIVHTGHIRRHRRNHELCWHRHRLTREGCPEDILHLHLSCLIDVSRNIGRLNLCCRRRKRRLMNRRTRSTRSARSMSRERCRPESRRCRRESSPLSTRTKRRY
jgi:hypothetical protein